MIRYDKLVMMHEMLNGQCPEKSKNRFSCRYSCISMFAISCNPISAYLKGSISRTSMLHVFFNKKPVYKQPSTRHAKI